MNSIKQIARLNATELEKCTPPNASWHTDYRDTAYIHIGGLPFELSEGDVLTIFSQYGSPVHIHLARDKDTGKSRGFGWLKYEDQKSCDLAVDNLSGAQVLGRVLSVDHARYKMKEGERETVGEDVSSEDDRGTPDESESEEDSRPMIREEVELQRLLREHDEDDPMKAYLVQEKRAEVEEALKAVTISKAGRSKDEKKHMHRHRHRRHRSRGESEDGMNGHKSRRRDGRDEDEHEEARAPHKSSKRQHHTSNGHKSSRRRPSPLSASSNERHHRKLQPLQDDSDSTDDRSRRRREED